MRYLLIFLLAVSAYAQGTWVTNSVCTTNNDIVTCEDVGTFYPDNFAVKFWGAGNTNNYPTYWPMVVNNIGMATNADAGWFVFSTDQLADLKATNQTALNIAKSNKVYAAQAQIKANLAAVVLAYSNLQWCADNWSSVTNLNTLKIAVKAEGDLLLKLKPVLTQLYRGE